MNGHPCPPRSAVAKAAAARSLARARRAREARELIEKFCRGRSRAKLGSLRDRTLQPRTARRYAKQVREFFIWMEKTGRSVPDRTIDFDAILCEWCEHLWAEGDPKGIVNGALCGLAHYVPALRGKLAGAWRLYKAWGRCERARQAPPLHRNAATMIVLAFHSILRTNEFMSIIGTDCLPEAGVMLVVLRDTKMGQRLGINQETTVSSCWLKKRLLEAVNTTTPGLPLLCMKPPFFRKLWKRALRDCGLPACFTPYSLRRGGATCLFQCCGSFDVVVDKGRWLNAQSCRVYISSALAELGGEEFDTQHLAKFERILADD